jgi:flagellar biosynthetic protein FlhB
MIKSMQNGLDVSSTAFDAGEIVRRSWSVLEPVAGAMIPVLMIGMLAGVCAGFLQVGFKATAEPLNPNFNRINPVEGFKRLLSRQAGFEFIKTVVKLIAIGLVAYRDVVDNWDALLNLSALSPGESVVWVGGLLSMMLLKVAVLWLVIGLADYLFQRQVVEKQLMMTKDEVRREMRETETSPELRAEMHRRRQRLARARMMQNVKHADVVITNPLEYAVAIKYDPKKSAAPICLAKGRHLTADRIRTEAKKARVPIVPNPPLARSLFKEVEVGDAIPQALYQAVAEVLAYVFRLKGRKF